MARKNWVTIFGSAFATKNSSSDCQFLEIVPSPIRVRMKKNIYPCNSAQVDDDEFSPKLWSVGVFMSGIITARFGLWVADLSITQLLQENVQEEHREYFLYFKGHFFSDHSDLTNRLDGSTQLSLIFLRISSCFFGFLPENYSIILE